MSVKKCVLLIVASLVICDSALVDLITKCGKDDTKCQTQQTQTLFKEMCAGSGVNEGIPKLDPYNVKDLTLEVPDLMTATLVDGQVKGLGSCEVLNFSPDFDIGRTLFTTECARIVVKGHYKVSSTAPLLKTLFGGEDLHGDGKTKIILEKLYLKLQMYFDLVQKKGDIYVKDKNFEILDLNIERANFNVTNLYLGKEDSSEKLSDFMNKNFKTALSTVGKVFGNSVINEGLKHVRTVMQKLPVSTYIIEDMSSYVRQ